MRPMRPMLLGVAAAAAAVLIAPRPAAAQQADVPALIQLVQEQPAGMDRATWKDRRRDAARKLGASGDKRAVPVLIELVETETFDIIGEIAIEGLGNLGDAAAIEPLQRVAADPARDRSQRDLAKKALARLGAKPDDGVGSAGGGDTGGGADAALLGRGGGTPVGGGSTDDGAAPAGPALGDDVLAATERLTLALGSAHLGWDTVRDRLDFDLDVKGSLERTMDRETSGYAWGADAAVVSALDDPGGAASGKLFVLAAGGHGEYRAYTATGLYGIGLGAARLEASRLSSDDGNGNTNSDRWVAVDAQVGLGVGYGRVLDVGTRMRVARIATALARSRSLGRPIDDATAAKLQRAWWGLRGELGAHRRLTTTVAILREAGVLLGEPDAGTTYELLQVLQDGAYDRRASGVDVHVAFAESYLRRWRYPSDEDAGVADGRLESLLVDARVGRQLGDQTDLTVDGFARLRLIAPDGTPKPWAVGARGTFRRFVYADHFDPRGAFDLTGEVGASDDDLDQNGLGVRLGGELGWTMILSRASSLRLAGTAALDSGELFIGARLEAAYGFLDAGFARSLPAAAGE